MFSSVYRLFEVILRSRRMYASTWLERLFQSCQRKSNKTGSIDEQVVTNNHHHHRMLNYEQLPNFGNDALVGSKEREDNDYICDGI